MDYFIRKSLHYYFMMGEITETGVEAWRFIAHKFGVEDADIKAYEPVVQHETLGEILSCKDVYTYKNYLGKYCRDENEFGNRSEEMLVLDCKFKALERVHTLFNGELTRGNRLGSLAHKYETSHSAAVLYALCVLYINGEAGSELAKSILYKELTEGKNSAAGIVLLNTDGGNEGEIMSYLGQMPDMRVLPNEYAYLVKRHGCGGTDFKGKRVIGF